MKKLTFININEMNPVFEPDEVKKIGVYLQQKFSSFLNNERFEIESGHSGDQVQIKLTLANKEQTFFYPIESIFIQSDESDEKMTPSDAALLMLDYLILYFEEFLSEDRNVFLPLDWSVHQSEEFSFFLRGFVRNLKIEKTADELLSQLGHGEHSIMPISSEC